MLKGLKCNKATGPVGLVYELFKPGVAGSDLLQSVLVLCNKIKASCQIPEFLELTNISSLYKQRGSKSDLNNDRGVFNVVIVRSILDKLVYNDYYEIIDENMSDSNVGGRKRRNIRDNLFIVYGIINYALKNGLDVDMDLYDIAKCFDAMWHQETMNDLWDVGVQDDKFALVSQMNTRCQIANKTPVGMTDRFTMEQIEMQGTVLGPIKCSVQIDTLGRDCYRDMEGLFLYKDMVYVPPLGMIDDIISFSDCGVESLKTNAIINAKIEAKKLELGPSKCFNIHVGRNSSSCQNLKVHKHDIINKTFETYLGDKVCSSGSNSLNVDNKVNLGIGAVSQILSMLNKVSLGHNYFEIAFIMKETMLISKLVSSSEVWYNVSKDQYTKLERIDELYLRRIFNVAISVPKESLYIEAGCIPVKYLIKIRRLMYLWNILHLDKSELLYKFYFAQKLSSDKDDWVLQVRKDALEINLQLSDEEIIKISQEKFREIVKIKTTILAIKSLNEVKLKHSKTENLKLTKISPAEYLSSKNLNLEEIQTLYKLRTRMISVKMNFKSQHKENIWCETCQLFPETQQHLTVCPVIKEKCSQLIDYSKMNHQMIFQNISRQEKFAKNYLVLLKSREDIISSMRSDG